jgi:hypothetical protein
MSTPAQLTLYWREWRACAEALKALGKASDDVVRKALQADAIGGIDKSSKKLTNAELTRVLAKFRSYSRPADFAAQMRAQEEPEARRAATIQKIEQLGAEVGIRGGLAGVSTYFKKWLGGKAVGLCDDDTLRKLVFILERRKAERGAGAGVSKADAPAMQEPAAAQAEPVPTQDNPYWDGEF